MARPLLLPDRFSSRELAVAADLTPRNMALLVDRELAPLPTEASAGRGSHRSYDSVALGAITLVGALHQAGMELLVAARLAGALTEEYVSNHRRLPSNLATYLQRPLNPSPGHYPWDQELPNIDPDDDYWLHERLRSHTGIYRPWIALRGDLILEIVNQAYVFTRQHGLNIQYFSPVLGTVPANPEYQIEGKGGVARVVPIHEGIRSFDFSIDHESADILRERQSNYLRVRDNAVTRLEINVGLAIRNGLDRLADNRAERTQAA